MASQKQTNWEESNLVQQGLLDRHHWRAWSECFGQCTGWWLADWHDQWLKRCHSICLDWFRLFFDVCIEHTLGLLVGRQVRQPSVGIINDIRSNSDGSISVSGLVLVEDQLHNSSKSVLLEQFVHLYREHIQQTDNYGMHIAPLWLGWLECLKIRTKHFMHTNRAQFIIIELLTKRITLPGRRKTKLLI